MDRDPTGTSIAELCQKKKTPEKCKLIDFGYVCAKSCDIECSEYDFVDNQRPTTKKIGWKVRTKRNKVKYLYTFHFVYVHFLNLSILHGRVCIWVIVVMDLSRVNSSTVLKYSNLAAINFKSTDFQINLSHKDESNIWKCKLP